MLTDMNNQLKHIFLVNVVFVVLYVLVEWGEFLSLNTFTFNNVPVKISAMFPWGIGELAEGGASGTALTFNFTLALFLLAIMVNLYFIIGLQRTNEAKQNPSQNAPLPS